MEDKSFTVDDGYLEEHGLRFAGHLQHSALHGGRLLLRDTLLICYAFICKYVDVLSDHE